MRFGRPASYTAVLSVNWRKQPSAGTKRKKIIPYIVRAVFLFKRNPIREIAMVVEEIVLTLTKRLVTKNISGSAR